MGNGEAGVSRGKMQGCHNRASQWNRDALTGGAGRRSGVICRAAGSLDRYLGKNPDGLNWREGIGLAVEASGPQLGVFGGGQVMAALEAFDVTAVVVRVAVQVAVAPGTALEPEHGLTSVGVSTLRLALRPLSWPSYRIPLCVGTTLYEKQLPVRYFKVTVL